MLHIAIAGNIGAGKTSLAKKLASHYNWEVCFEAVEENPYLQDFYKDMTRWAFHLQIYFLNSRFEQVLKAQKNKIPTIQDRTIYEDAYVFAQNLKDSGLMSKRDYENYYQVFSTMTQFVKAPDLLIYLEADLDKLKSQIQKRGRNFEQNIPDNYLLQLNHYYKAWLDNYKNGKVLKIDMQTTDFVNNPLDWERIVECIDTSLKLETNSSKN